MKYQAYSEYKESGVEWLGKLPKEWGISQIKYLCYVNDGNHGEEYPKESDYTVSEDGVPFIRGGNISRSQAPLGNAYPQALLEVHATPSGAWVYAFPNRSLGTRNYLLI